MADDFDIFNDILGEPLEKKEENKFKPRTRSKAKPSKGVPAQQSEVGPTLNFYGSDTRLNSDLDYVISPCSNTGASSNSKGKLQPQRKPFKLNNIDEIEGLNQKSDTTLQAHMAYNEFDDFSLETPTSTVETNEYLQTKEIDKNSKGKKVTFQIPEESQVLDPGPVTSDEIHGTSEAGLEQNAENYENTQNSEDIVKDSENAPDLDSLFDFYDNCDPVPETENNYDDDPKDKDYTENEKESTKPSRKRKNISTDSDANINEDSSPNKNEKLPHKTRSKGRKRRQVDPALLEIPDGEIDRRQISIRNLILLAEKKEKKSKKDGNSKKPSPSQSVEPERREQQDEFDFDFNGDQSEKYQDNNNEEYEDEFANETPQLPPKKLNYHSYMNRSYNGRWSKSDTELFYMGIRQFGTDFEMIKTLFPNKTRRQIRDKFKNEDKKNPIAIRDATKHRLNDNSQYEKVIEILQIEPSKLSSPQETNNEPSSEVGDGKKKEKKELDQEQEEIEENYEETPEDFNNYSGKKEEPTDLDTLFDWD